MADAYAVITPAGELGWYPLARAADVEAVVGGTVAQGALATVTVAGARIPGRGPLKVLASDIALLFPEQYEPNPLAGAVLEALSAGWLTQPWRGSVALVEYAADPVTGEVLWPGEMSPRWIDVVNAAVRRARGKAAADAGRQDNLDEQLKSLARLRRYHAALEYEEDFDREWRATMCDPLGRAALTIAYQQAQRDGQDHGGLSCCGTTATWHRPWCETGPRRYREGSVHGGE
jgi:hypothetical protein